MTTVDTGARATRRDAYPGGMALPPPLGEWAAHPDRACAHVDDPEIFFPISNKRDAPAAAIELCHFCPVRLPGRAYALAAGPDLHGVWGGTTPAQRALIRQVRPR